MRDFMRGHIDIILGLIILLGSCGYSDSGPTKNLLTSKDTVRQDLADYLNDPKKDINTFGLEIDYLPLKVAFNDLSRNGDIKTTIKTDLCAGDNCTSYKILFDTISGTKLYLIKSDYGEYGSANNQFLFRNDSIILFRNYQMGPDFATDTSTVYTFGLSETIYEFTSDRVKIRKRSKIQTDQSKYTLSDLVFSDSLSSRTVEEKFCKDELQRLLDIEKIAE